MNNSSMGSLGSCVDIDANPQSDVHDGDLSAETLLGKRMTIAEKIQQEASGLKSSSESSKSAGGMESPQSILKKSIFNGVAFHHAGMT